MGDRVIYVAVDGQTALTGIYSHWGGSYAKEVVEAAAPTLRKGDLEYATARLCAAVCKHAGENDPLGVGIFPPPKPEDFANGFMNYSQGDAGVIVVDVNTGEWKGYAGYAANLSGKLELARG